MLRKALYDKLSTTLTLYEEDEIPAEDLYDILVEIQNNWETVITGDDLDG